MDKEKNMELTLNVLQRGVDFSVFDELADISALYQKCENVADGEKIKIKFPCRYFNTDRQARIIYFEKNDNGLASIKNQIVFDKLKSGVFISKSGSVTTEFKIFEGKTEKSEYLTEYGSFCLGIRGLKIAGKFNDDGGILFLDYISELYGCDAQRIKMRIEIKPADISEKSD